MKLKNIGGSIMARNNIAKETAEWLRQRVKNGEIDTSVIESKPSKKSRKKKNAKRKTVSKS